MNRPCARCGVAIDTASSQFCPWCGHTNVPVLPPAGWHADPGDHSQWRYWDGATWTEHTHRPEAPIPAPPILIASADQPALPLAGWYGTHPDHGALRYWDGHNWTTHLLQRGSTTHRVSTPPPAVQVGLPSLTTAILVFGIGFAANVGVAEALIQHGNPGGNAAQLLLGSLALWAVLLSGTWLVVKRRGSGNVFSDLYISWAKRDWLVGLLASFAARGAASIITLIFLAAFSDSMKDPQIGRPVDEFTGWTFLAFAFVAVIGAPIVEEIFFRGLIQTRLVERIGAIRGIGVTSVLFGAAHLIGWQGPESLVAAAAIAGSGAVLGYVRYRSGRLGTSIAAHAFFNLFVVVVVGIGLLV